MPKQDDSDRFKEVMDTFVVVSSEELRDTETIVQTVESDYQTVSKFFAEDGKLQPEEFFAIFKRFATLFENARKEMMTERETAVKTAKRAEERKARLAGLKIAKENPNAPKIKPLVKPLDDDDLDKLIAETSGPSDARDDDTLEESVMDDMIAKVQDGKINTRAFDDSEDEDDDYDEVAAETQLAETRDLMKRLGLDIDNIGNADAGEPSN